MKKLAILIPCLLASFSSSAASVNYEQLHKQLNIMNNIIKSSVSEHNNPKAIKLSGIESTYLQGQGVVFTVRSQSRYGGWGSFHFDMAMPDMPPMPPMPPLSPEQIETIKIVVDDEDGAANIDVDKEVAKAMEMASRSYERAIDVHHEQREHYRDFKEEQRDIAYELRDIDRESRDMEYQLKRSKDDKHQGDIKKELKALKKQKMALIEKKKALVAKAKALKSQQIKAQAKRENERKGYYANLSQAMAETLCLYGNGLKALPKGEHVTVILKSGGDKVGRQYQDKIHVFTKRDINGCATDEIDAKKLLSKGSAYQF